MEGQPRKAEVEDQKGVETNSQSLEDAIVRYTQVSFWSKKNFTRTNTRSKSLQHDQCNPEHTMGSGAHPGHTKVTFCAYNIQLKLLENVTLYKGRIAPCKFIQASMLQHTQTTLIAHQKALQKGLQRTLLGALSKGTLESNLKSTLESKPQSTLESTFGSTIEITFWALFWALQRAPKGALHLKGRKRAIQMYS